MFARIRVNIDPSHTVANTNAERLRQACDVIALAHARRGDLIFFERTYDTAGASHVGIVYDPLMHTMLDDHQRPGGPGPGFSRYSQSAVRRRTG